MPFLVVKPEQSARRTDVKGGPGGETLWAELDWWLGDDLVGCAPELLATERLAAALRALPQATGFDLAATVTTPSAFFQASQPGRSVPTFEWLRVSHRPGVEDMGRGADGDLVVSGRVFAVLLAFRLEQAVIAQFGSPTRAGPASG